MCIVIKFERVIKSDKILSLEKKFKIFTIDLPFFFFFLENYYLRNFFSRTNEGKFSKRVIFNWWKWEIFNGQVEETSLNS